jgi:hypothetical protein
MIKKIDILLLILFPIFAVIFSLLFNLNFLSSMILFFIIPSIYLSIRTKSGIKRAIIFSLGFSIMGGLMFSYYANIDKSWYVPTIFPFRIFHEIAIEETVWIFLITYFFVIFYEHFFDKGVHKLIDNSMKHLIYFLTLLFGIFLFSVFTNQAKHIDYFYFKGGLLLGLIPLVAFLFTFPKYVSKFMKTATYFVYIGLLHELTALQLNHWSFPGKNFIGWVNIFGYKFPYEEFLFFVILFSVSVLTYFEFFDDRKNLTKARVK